MTTIAKIVLLLIVAAGSVAAQQPIAPPLCGYYDYMTVDGDCVTTTVFTAWEKDLDPNTNVEPAPHDAHDYTIGEIKMYTDWMKKHDFAGYETLIFIADKDGYMTGKFQSISVSEDGKIELYNITWEDAFLLVWGERLQEIYEKRLKYEEEKEEREHARRKSLADIPPTKAKVNGSDWTVQNLSDWSNGKDAGDTYCNGRRIRILEDSTAPPKKVVMMHELMHAATDCEDGPSTLHKDIYLLAPALLKILQDNPEIVKYLLAKEKP